MKEIIFWFVEKSPGGVLLEFDKYTLPIFKALYIITRVLFRIALGKENRYRSSSFQILYVGTISPSFLLIMYFSKIKRLIGLGYQKPIIVTVPKYNYQVYCPPNIDDFLNMTIREENILKHFYPELKNTVIDIGAHMGRYTMISSNKVGKEGRVIAIEANPAVLKILDKNTTLNKLTNVSSLNYAVFSEKTKIKLFLPGEEKEKYTIYNTIMPDRAQGEKKFVEVNADTLDNILQNIGISHSSINWIKIDVEGAELEVLKGAHKVLSESKRISLLIEVHDLGQGKNLYEPIVNLLRDHGFSIKFEKSYEDRERHIILSKQK